MVIRDGAVLLVRHRGGQRPWSLPGGGVERGERLVAAALREVREETGVSAAAPELLGVYEALRWRVSDYIAVFVCAADAEPRPPRSIEIAEARYFPLDALPAGIDGGSARRIAEYRVGARGIADQY